MRTKIEQAWQQRGYGDCIKGQEMATEDVRERGGETAVRAYRLGYRSAERTQAERQAETG